MHPGPPTSTPDGRDEGSDLPTGPADALRLDEQLCFALYAATNAVVRAYRPLLRAAGLTYPQYVVLMALWEADDISVSDLGARLDLPLSGLAPVLDRLVDAGFVERRRDRTDRRVVKLVLTERGRQTEERAAVAQHQVRCQTELSEPSLRELRSALHDLTETLTAHRTDHPA